MARTLTIVKKADSADSTTTSLALAVEDYLASCRARGLSYKTVKQNYGYSLRSVLLPWCDANGITEFDQLTQRQFDRLTASVVENARSEWTAHSYIRPMRQFMGWAKKVGDADKDGATPQLPRLNRKVIDVLTRDETDWIENAADSERDKLIIRILADTGMRVSELCGLTIDGVTRQERGPLLKVKGKRGDERLVPIRPELARRIERYKASRPKDIASPLLFVSRRRSHGEYAPLKPGGVRQMVEAVIYRSGVKKRVYPHLFRHSFATYALRRGMNPVQLAQILGHRSLQMIDRFYAHLNSNDAYDAVMEMLNPR
jgi:integrase/recombinase XerD